MGEFLKSHQNISLNDDVPDTFSHEREREEQRGEEKQWREEKRDGLSVDEVGENWMGRKSGVSKWSDAGPLLTPRLVLFDLVKCERVLFFHTFCANGQVISSSLTQNNTKPTSLSRDARLHETILGCDMYYHTEWNLNKMNSWITIFFFFLHLCFPWCFKHESWGKWASLRKKKLGNDNQIAAATTVWLVWYSALITENAEFIIYTFHSFLCSYGLRNIELWELCN